MPSVCFNRVRLNMLSPTRALTICAPATPPQQIYFARLHILQRCDLEGRVGRVRREA